MSTSTRRFGAVLAAAALGLLLVASAASARQIQPSKLKPIKQKPSTAGVRSIDFSAATVRVQRKHGTVYLTLRGIGDDFRMRTVAPPAGGSVLDVESYIEDAHASSVKEMRQIWESRLGPTPSVELVGSNGRTTLFGITGKPVFMPRRGTLVISANATPTNAGAATSATKLGNGLKVKIRPTLAAGYSRPVTSVRQSSTGCTTVQPARANTSFCLAYDPQLGSGGQSWANVLSGTMQSTPTCQDIPPPTQVAGNPVVTGQIDVYESAADAQSALSTSANMGYDSKIVSGEANAAFDTSESTSSNSVYAIAQVNLTSGTVNLGKPTLTADRAGDAAAITTVDDALAFISDCGDSVPVNYTVGASWMSVLQINVTDSSSSSSLYASIKGSYKGASAGATFSGAVSSSNQAESMFESDYCVGPATCFSVPGYAAAVTGSSLQAALDQFTANYSTMLTNLSGTCNPGTTYSSCITQIQYQPLYQLLPSTGSAGNPSPSTLVNQAAAGVYGIQANFNTWGTDYQALETANPTSSQYSSWDANLGNLEYVGPFCDISGLSSMSTCMDQISACATYISKYLSWTSTPCLPSDFPIPGLTGMQNPTTVVPSSTQ